MKKAIYFIAYLAAAILGILLLIFNRDALSLPETVPATLRGIVLVSGIVLVFPGLLLLLSSFRQRKDENGAPVVRPWYSTLTALVCLIWGITCICAPGFLTEYLAVTIGITLIIAGFGQIVLIVNAARPYSAAPWWYAVPFCVACVGVISILLIYDTDSLDRSASTAAVVAGISLVVYCVNGIVSLGRRKRIAAETKSDKVPK